MFYSQRILTKIGATQSDDTIALNDFRTGTKVIAITGNTDYIFIGSDLPFNHRHFEVTTPNDQSASVAVDIWWGRNWTQAVDVIDRTSIGGKSLAQSGIIQWEPHRLKGWDIEEDSEDVTGITIAGIYRKFWCRIYWSAALKSTTTLQFIGHKFSDDTAMRSFYPDLMNADLIASFETGKTTWDTQHFMAAEQIIEELTRRGIVESRNQILDHELFKEASCHKVAEIVYRGMGSPFDANRELAHRDYLNCMNKRIYHQDVDKDGRLGDIESNFTVGWLKR